MQAKVSVIMPAFNAGIFISEAIESVRAQTLQNWELIVVDDGSADDTASIVEAFAVVDSRIRVMRIAHQGIEAALNEGLQQARADLIARMDADDICLPNRLERQVKYLNANSDVGVVASSVELIKREARSEGLETYVEWTNSLHSHEQISLGRFIDAPLIHPSVCFRKELVSKFGGYRAGDFPEDYELWLRWLHHGVRMEKLPDVLLQWRDHSGKLTRQDARYREAALWSVKAPYFERWFRDQVSAGRPLLIWGSGRRTRSRLVYFEKWLEDRNIEAFIDVSPKKIGKQIQNVPVIAPEQIQAFQDAFVVSMVGSRGARALIRQSLESLGKQEMQDFVFLA